MYIFLFDFDAHSSTVHSINSFSKISQVQRLSALLHGEIDDAFIQAGTGFGPDQYVMVASATGG